IVLSDYFFFFVFFFFQAEDGIRDRTVTGVQTCALPISDSGNTGTFTSMRMNSLLDCLVRGRCQPGSMRDDHFAGSQLGGERIFRSEERRVGKECRSRRSTEQ